MLLTSNAPKGVTVGARFRIISAGYVVEVEQYNYEKALYKMEFEQFGNTVSFITSGPPDKELFTIREDGTLKLQGRNVPEILSFDVDDQGNLTVTLYLAHVRLTLKEEAERPLAGEPFATVTIIKHPTDE